MRIPTISVIVPIYNVEEYLHQCIDSILLQTFTDYELILVDDGSSDQCAEICDDYGKQDPRVIVIHQANQGAAAARNRALDISRGKYIAFIDSDDVVAENYLEVLYECAICCNADISMCSISIPENMLNTHSEDWETTCRIMTGKEASLLRYREPDTITVAPTAKLISKETISDIRFPEGSLCEDQGFIPYVIYRAEKIAIIGTKMYFYRLREGSLEHSPFTRKRFDDVQHMNAFISFLKEHNEKEIVKQAQKRRNNRLAMYTLQARVANVSDIPKDCYMNLYHALYLVRKYYPDNRYSWYLSQILPFLVRPHEYIRKIESIVTGKPL